MSLNQANQYIKFGSLLSSFLGAFIYFLEKTFSDTFLKYFPGSFLYSETFNLNNILYINKIKEFSEFYINILKVKIIWYEKIKILNLVWRM